MAVIIPDMDIPSNCMACKLSYSSPFGDVMCAANGYRANKQKCLLKSADERKGKDCVSRQFMYELGATCIATRNENGELIALGAIEEMPSVTPQEPKTGHWIYKTMEGQFCSICNEQSVWKFNYCPNCGCRMVEPQESEK